MIGTWIAATRPKTLLASICPVSIGSALAYRDGALHIPSACAALIGALLIQIGTNLTNDYFDFRQGADREDRLGPIRPLQAKQLTPRAVLYAAVTCFLLVACVCVYLSIRAGWIFAVIGCASIVCGIAYTAGRHSLAYLGIADVFVVVFFGPVAVAGTYFVQARQVTSAVILAGLAPGFLSNALLVINNLRDVKEDRRVSKKTLVVRFGTSFGRLHYILSVSTAAIIPCVLWTIGYAGPTVLLASTPLLPSLRVFPKLWTTQGTAWNGMLAATATLLLGYSVAFCLVMVLTA